MKKRPPIPFSVDRHTCVTKFSDGIAEDVIQEGVDLLAHDDTPKDTGVPRDVPTDVPLDFNGHVGTFSRGNGIVKTDDDLKALFGLPGNVHVVCEIHCCGGEKPGILGCCGLGQPIIVKQGIGTDSAAVLWMHELGHYKGLCHRDDRFALMASTINVANKTVNQYEHDVFEDIIKPSKCDNKKKKRKVSAIEFVHKVFIEGVPYEQANRFTADAVPPLLKLLDKPGKQRSRLNVITVLGIIGDRQAWKPIKNAFERGSGELSRQNYAAKLAAPLALGYLLAKGHDPRDQQILEYLNTGMNNPSEWSKRVSWRESDDQSDQARNAHLTTLTILGMGISGRPEALIALQTLHDQLAAMQAANSHGPSLIETGKATTSIRTSGLSEFGPGTLCVLKAAIRTNKRVHEDGLVKYYRDRELEQLGFNL